MATRDAAPLVDHLSSALVRAFGHMLDHPDHWFNAAEIEATTGVSQPTVYRRFGNLVAAGALSAKRIGDFRCWTLRPSWERSTVALELQRRRVALTERRGQISDP